MKFLFISLKSKINFLLWDHELMLNHLLLVNQLSRKYDLIDQHNDDLEIMVYQVTFHQEYIRMTKDQLNKLKYFSKILYSKRNKHTWFMITTLTNHDFWCTIPSCCNIFC